MPALQKVRPEFSARSKNERAKDFERRAIFAPDNVYTHRNRNWRYIPVHWFEDEQESEAGFVDAYCHFGNDTAFLATARAASTFEESLSVTTDGNFPYLTKVFARTCNKLTRTVFEGLMERCYDWMQSTSVGLGMDGTTNNSCEA